MTDRDLEQAEDIRIVSGEGKGQGIEEVYTGERTFLAIRARLTQERRHGDWSAYRR